MTNKTNVELPIIIYFIQLFNTVPMTNDRDSEATILITSNPPTANSTTTHVYMCDSSVSPSEVVAWVLVVILGVLFIGLLSVVLLRIFKKRQARDTSTDNTTPKYEMEGNPCYEATAVK